MDKDKIIKQQEVEIKKLKEEIKILKKQRGGRPSKFTDEEKASIEMYRLQGKKLTDIAAIFKCSTRTIERILKKREKENNENNNKEYSMKFKDQLQSK